ncbi:MAG: hypothetical protein FGM24_02970 [Candidatus Kapabacteria bacterium]|nr:hypothetical protein [Candidatus Kapabacteria bacterium]
MDRPSTSEQWIDLLLLRTTAPDYATHQPYYTTGSIVSAAIVRVALIGIGGIVARQYIDGATLWYAVLFLMWALGAYPAYRQYQEFNTRIDKMSEDTLCGKCRYFDPTNQLCTILDEHVVDDMPPCEGEAWEPR